MRPYAPLVDEFCPFVSVLW
jgi:hypothetical protein